MRSQQYDEINDSSDTEAEHLLNEGTGASPATPHSPWRAAALAVSVCGAVAFVIAVSSNPSAGGSSLGNANTELSEANAIPFAVKNTLKAMNDDTPHPGSTDPARQHLIHEGQGDDDTASASAMDDEGYGMAMSSCGKGATCAPSPPPTWRAHEGPTPGGPTPPPSKSPSVSPTNVVELHKNTPAPQPVWHFPTKSPTTSEPTVHHDPTPAPTHHKKPTDAPTSPPAPTLKPTLEPTTHGEKHNSPKPTHAKA
eukprot:CAMPEP_0182567500 /NCGR_PEP_ID=MMETSP1324-20130603/8713_1 /TAXON_ID=236786 /ORGANISM="Florenciella sp., Strain RCC1587" /LENGTH=252 /DNA_ID=CAMNT_0024781511 /DNA_START=43 /DNA_END=798 /DNA_ORIENTATION=+